jgi:quercetin dioxygenase-like cupin family protein
MVQQENTTRPYIVLARDEGLILKSGPGRDLTFKVTGEDTGGAFDYFTVGVAPHGGPPLHVHHGQEETIHVLKGRFKIRIGDEIFYCNEGGFAYLPSKVPHAFLNLTDEPGEIIVVYTPGGGHKFYEEFGPIARSGPPDPKVLAPLFEKYNMSLLGPPLKLD